MANKREDNSAAGNAARAAIAAQQRGNRRRNRGTVDEADWGSADAGKLLNAVCAIARTGGAIQFGYTRDKGAFAIRVLGDGEPYNEYVRATEDIDLYLEGLAVDYS